LITISYSNLEGKHEKKTVQGIAKVKKKKKKKEKEMSSKFEIPFLLL